MSYIWGTHDGTSTIYRVELFGADAATFQFDWKNTNSCGTFTKTGPKAIWDHPSPPCGVSPHPGDISVTAVRGQVVCTALYTKGSEATTGDPAKCEGNLLAIAPSSSLDWLSRSLDWRWLIGAALVAFVSLGFGGWFLSPHGPPAAWARRTLVPDLGGVAVATDPLGPAAVAVRRKVVPDPGGQPMWTDPCAAEKAYVAELEARIARRDAELGPSVKRGDTYLPPALRDTIAEDNDLLAKARAALARCLGTSAPGDSPGPVTPAPTGSIPLPPTVSGPDVQKGVGTGALHPTSFSPPDPSTPPPIPHKPPPPPKPTPCTEGATMPPETKCAQEGELWFFSLARVEIEGALMFGEGTVEDALHGLEAFLDGIDVATGLIDAVTNPVGSILGTAGVPGPDSITTTPRDAAMKGLDKTVKSVNRLRRWGIWKVRIPKAACRLSCTWQEVCRNGNWAVEKSIHMQRIGNATVTEYEQRVDSPEEAQRFIAKLMGMVTAKNAATNALFDACERQCR